MTNELEHIPLQRQEKLKRIEELGINPFPVRYHRSHTAQSAAALLDVEDNKDDAAPEVNVAGRIMAMRGMGKVSFVDLRDGSGKIQLMLKRDNLGETEAELLKTLDIGDFIGVTGKVFRTRRGEPTVEATSATLLAKSLQPLPEKWHGLTDVEMRFRQRYLDLISNQEVRDTFITRSRVISAIRKFLDGRDFLEVETPMLQAEAGGAMARPFITHHNSLDRDFYLRIALELYLKRLIVSGFDRVYEIGRVFRNEGISVKHNPEFTMLESYQAYADYHDVMQMVEDMVYQIAQSVLGGETVEYGGKTISLKPSWQHLDLREAIMKYADGLDFLKLADIDDLRQAMQARGLTLDPNKDKGKLIDEVISKFVEPNLVQPTFLIDYPIEMSPLAKIKPGSEGRIVERFEGFICGMEVANAFSELNNPLEQRRRFLHQLKDRSPSYEEERETIDEDYIRALEYGMPPTGGLGIGIDRLTMLLTGNESIREVILFPHLKERA